MQHTLFGIPANSVHTYKLVMCKYIGGFNHVTRSKICGLRMGIHKPIWAKVYRKVETLTVYANDRE
jgi:hypothetical protein